MNDKQQWQDVKDGYIRQIEKNLARTDHPRRTEILSDVKEHLERKYAELPARERNWDGYQQIITEMGPPEEYAELLTEERTAERSRFGINELLAIIFVATLIAIGVYLVYTAKKSPTTQKPAQTEIPEIDERFVGKWVSVDFVAHPDNFKPREKQWQGELYLKGLTLFNNGTTSGPWTWTKDHLWHPGDKTEAKISVQEMQGKTYLFMEWMSGDVTIRGMKPWYYVLVKEE